MQIPTFSKSIKIFILAIVLLEAANIGAMFYFLRSCSNSEKNVQPVVVETPATEEIGPLSAQDIASGQIGDVAQKPGQTMEQALLEVNPEVRDNPVIPPETFLPATVFNTQGTIISIQEDGITVNSNGSTFEDQLPRQIKVKFDDKTVVSEKGGVVKYTGLAGLKHLAAGGQVSLDSAQNIRGKTEFTARYVNK